MQIKAKGGRNWIIPVAPDVNGLNAARCRATLQRVPPVILVGDGFV